MTIALTKRKLETTVRDALADWLGPLGFRPSASGGVERCSDGRYEYVACVVSRVGGENRVQPFAQVGWLRRKKIYSHFMSENPDESNKIAVDVTFRYAHFKRDWTARMVCQTQEQVPAFLESLKMFLTDQMLPAMRSCATPRDALNLYLKKNEDDKTSFDPPSWYGHTSALTALILARLYAPEHFEPLKQRYRRQFEGLDSETLAQSHRLLAYLEKSDPLPELP